MKVDEGFDCSWLMIDDDDVSVDKMKASIGSGRGK